MDRTGIGTTVDRHRRRAPWRMLVLAVSMLQACGAGDAQLAGTWALDSDGMTAELTERAGSGNPMEAGLARMAMGMIAEMDWRMTLREDGTLSLHMEEPGSLVRANGQWSADGGAVRIEYLDAGERTASLTGRLEGSRLRLDPFEEGQPGLLFSRSREAAAVEGPPPPPPFGPLRADCPAEPAASRADGAPVDDIVNLRPGMSYDEVLAVLECRDDIRVVQTAPMWSISENYGIPTRQLLRASDGIPCDAREAGCESGEPFEPLRGVRREYVVAFTGMPEQEIARVIWRRSQYAEEDAQAVSVLLQSLNEKYGPPQLQATGDHLRLNRARPGATNLVWLYGRDGSAAPPPASQFSNAAMSWETCINGPQPQFSERHSWNSGCNLTIRAEILPQEGNPLLARELNMMVMNQRDLYHGGRQFNQALRLVSDERLREQSPAPEL